MKIVICLLLAGHLGLIVNAQEQGSLRLVNGSSPNRGRLEVYISGQWGTVCNDSWDYSDALVACRQLGYNGVSSYDIPISSGSSSQSIWLDDVGCSGTESKLIDCVHRGYGVHDCWHSEDVGISCQSQEQGSLRLVNGSSPNQGRLEVYISGQWGTVCDDSWGYSDALVACRQLGYTGVSDYDISISPGSSSQRIWLDDVECSGSESKLINCVHRGYGVHDCWHSEDVGISCLFSTTVRLAGGNTAGEGQVEVYYSGQWCSVCSTSSFGTDEATTVCRDLGYRILVNRTTTYYGYGSTTAYISCSGSQSSVNQCSIGTSSCSSGYRQYVACSNSNIRLVGGGTPSEGRVEMYYSGQWRRVCGTSSSFATDEATTVCRDLGYNNLVSRTTTYYGSSSGAVYISCYGIQSSLIQCSIRTSSCSSGRRGQYVVCSNSIVRLVGGSTSSEGRVEVYYSGQWRSVCSTSSFFGADEATTVCRELGYNNLISRTTVYYGYYNGSTTAYISCSGSQSSVSQCRIGTSSCSSGYRQYVVCGNLNNGDVRLVGGSTSNKGRVEVYYSGQWRSVCSTSSLFGSDEATTVCRQLGHQYLKTRSTTYYYSSGGTTPVTVSCSGSQNRLSRCSIYNTTCYSSYWQYVSCTNSSNLAQNSNGDVRLVGGRSQYEGRVEVYYNGQWQTVCNSYRTFGDVVCGQLGYGLVSGMRAVYQYTSSDSVSVSCSGGQSSLRECSFTEGGSCNYPVTVFCSNSNVYAPVVWTVLIPLVCGLVVLCVLCLPCCVAYHLYWKKKNGVVSSAPRHTSDDETVRYVATESEEQARVEYPTLSPPNYYDEVGDHSNARVDQNNSNPGQQTGVDTPVYETTPDGTRPQDSSPEWTANPNLKPQTEEYCTLQTAADNQEPHTVSQQFPTAIVDTVPGGNKPHDPPPEWTANPTSNYELPTGEYNTLQSAVK